MMDLKVSSRETIEANTLRLNGTMKDARFSPEVSSLNAFSDR